MTVDFERGFEWAEHAYHAGMSIEEIEAYADESGVEANDFDAGARAACRELETK